MNSYKKIGKQRMQLVDALEKALAIRVSKLERDLYRLYLKNIVDNLSETNGALIASNQQTINKINKTWKEFKKIHTASVNKLAGELTKQNTLSKKYFQAFDKKKTNARAKKVNARFQKRIGLTEAGAIAPNGFLADLVDDVTIRTEIRKVINNAVNRGLPKRELKENLKELIQGNEERAGKLTKFYRQVADDVYAKNDRIINKAYADELEMPGLIYNAGLVESSRDYCKGIDGQVRTIGEYLDYFESQGEFKGKLPDHDALEDAGGYNCRHSIDYIDKFLLLQLRPDLKEEDL